MLERVLTYLHNWFPCCYEDGEWEISGGSIYLPFIQNGQYFRIVGSVFNDGLHQYPASDLHDESFEGRIYGLAIPLAVINLVAEIEDWQDKNGSIADGPYDSESFGGYSYSRGSSGSSSGDGVSLNGWQSAFASRLSPWKRLYE